MSEELYQHLGGEGTLRQEAWPEFDQTKIMDKDVEVVVQLNGKVRGKILVASGSSEEQVKGLVMSLDFVKKVVEGETVKRTVFVPNKLINLVI